MHITENVNHPLPGFMSVQPLSSLWVITGVTLGRSLVEVEAWRDGQILVHFDTAKPVHVADPRQVRQLIEALRYACVLVETAAAPDPSPSPGPVDAVPTSPRSGLVADKPGAHPTPLVGAGPDQPLKGPPMAAVVAHLDALEHARVLARTIDTTTPTTACTTVACAVDAWFDTNLDVTTSEWAQGVSYLAGYLASALHAAAKDTP